MPGRKKPRDLTTNEALTRLFPKPVVSFLKQAAHGNPPKPRQKPSFPSHKKSSR